MNAAKNKTFNLFTLYKTSSSLEISTYDGKTSWEAHFRELLKMNALALIASSGGDSLILLEIIND